VRVLSDARSAPNRTNTRDIASLAGTPLGHRPVFATGFWQTTTFAFNQDSDRVRRADRTEDTSDLQDWFAGDRSIQITEEVIGLGSYGKTLTVLTTVDLEEKLEEIEEEENLNDSWIPRFRR
jgi:hypothetical protein